MMYRMPHIAGEWLDRTQTLAFDFEGHRYEGFAGDTISSALAASGVMLLGRSFKYHRPRGILSFANHDVNAMFQLGAIPNVRGDVTPLRAGMQVHAVNTFGGLAHDRARHLEAFARFLPVGFYYKAFHSKRLFPRFERFIRKVSGLGAIGLDAPRANTRKRYAFCDVLVIGGGVSGMRAALTAANAGAQVLLVDENARLGGSPSGAVIDAELVRSMTTHAAITVLSGSYAAGCYADLWVSIIERERMTKVRTKALVLATGAIEQPAVFRNNDLPGVMLASAAQLLLHRHAVAVGRRVVVMTLNRHGYHVATDLLSRGVTVTHVIDARAPSDAAETEQGLAARGVAIVHGDVVAAHASADHILRAVDVAVRGDADAVPARTIECDALLMSAGAAPATQLLLHAGGRVTFDGAAQMHVPSYTPAGVFVAGRANGVFDVQAKLEDAEQAGSLAASHAGFANDRGLARQRALRFPTLPQTLRAARDGKDFIDFDEDLQVKDLEHAAQEGFDSIELMKRYSTCGMGPSQGKLSNLNAARVLAQIRNEHMDAVGLTTARPMYHPVPMKHLAGRGFTPERATPLESRHTALGAVWMPAGNWRRPEYYARAGATRDDCIREEVAAVRSAVGIIDVGTLGKIEVHGPDAGLFLDRAYAGRYSDLAIGMTRYALMLDEAGTIVDDGVVARIHEHCYYFTTTTGNSATVYRELTRLNALWRLDCSLVNLTGHRAAFNLAGPRSRELLAKLTSLDLGAMPYLGVREGEVAGTHARLLRVGFVGELGYEIHVPFAAAPLVWDQLVGDGARAFGVEAQRGLRLEKGHFIVGQDTDGLTNPFEAQAAWAVRMQKPFFVGQRSLRILERRGPRQTLVGFEIGERTSELKECHLVIDGTRIAGRVTSVTYSHTLGKTIGLAMVAPVTLAKGNSLTIRLTDGRLVTAQRVATPFYDRGNQRQKFAEAA
jgi:sarcosine oxidase subunit alpha